MDYLVTPPAASAWTLDLESFRAALLERWPDAQQRDVPESDPTYALDFTILAVGRVDGAFGRDGQVIGLTGELPDVMTVALWFRSLVPAEQPLLFCDPALNGQVELIPDADPEQAAAAYLEDAA